MCRRGVVVSTFPPSNKCFDMCTGPCVLSGRHSGHFGLGKSFSTSRRTIVPQKERARPLGAASNESNFLAPRNEIFRRPVSSRDRAPGTIAERRDEQRLDSTPDLIEFLTITNTPRQSREACVSLELARD